MVRRGEEEEKGKTLRSRMRGKKNELNPRVLRLDSRVQLRRWLPTCECRVPQKYPRLTQGGKCHGDTQGSRRNTRKTFWKMREIHTDAHRGIHTNYNMTLCNMTSPESNTVFVQQKITRTTSVSPRSASSSSQLL